MIKVSEKPRVKISWQSKNLGRDMSCRTRSKLLPLCIKIPEDGIQKSWL